MSEQTYHRWRKEYDVLDYLPGEAAQGSRVRETMRLKKLAANQALDDMIREEVASGNF